MFVPFIHSVVQDCSNYILLKILSNNHLVLRHSRFIRETRESTTFAPFVAKMYLDFCKQFNGMASVLIVI